VAIAAALIVQSKTIMSFVLAWNIEVLPVVISSVQIMPSTLAASRLAVLSDHAPQATGSMIFTVLVARIRVAHR
jgi:hypothetical protein